MTGAVDADVGADSAGGDGPDVFRLAAAPGDQQRARRAHASTRFQARRVRIGEDHAVTAAAERRGEQEPDGTRAEHDDF